MTITQNLNTVSRAITYKLPLETDFYATIFRSLFYSTITRTCYFYLNYLTVLTKMDKFIGKFIPFKSRNICWPVITCLKLEILSISLNWSNYKAI